MRNRLLACFLLAFPLGCSVPNEDVIIFEKWPPRESGEDHEVQLWSIRADGTDLRQLTSGGNDGEPSWSPDRKRIAYTRFDEGLRVLKINDLSSVQLDMEKRCDNPQWIDDQEILFAMATGPEEKFSRSWRLHKVSLTDRSTHILNTGGIQGAYSPVLSPDGRLLAFRGFQGDRAAVLTADVNNIPDTARPLLVEAAYPYVWTPEGDAIVISHGGECASLDLEGNVHSLFPDLEDCNVSWSPAGDRVAFDEDNAIFVLDLESGKKTMLAQAPAGSLYMNPVWR